MEENQNIEFKEVWKDEYLKWICGFANAEGGKILIGANDNGVIIGIDNYKKLLEDIPNKVRDVLGIVVDVDLKSKDNKYYLEISVEAYPYPVNYKGQYHYRSGSTKQELKGAALDRFMLRKQGKTWDGVPMPFVRVEDLDNQLIELFKSLVRSKKRMSDLDLNVDNKGLLEKLRLFDGPYLKRAAILLFMQDPEKYITGAFIKVGRFGNTDSELIYQDEIHGSLFKQIASLMDLLTTKYLSAYITYNGLQRVETFPVPEEALREALLNAIVHKDYSQPVPIQISVYDDKMMIWNCGMLPESWTVDTLWTKHGSYPFNPEIANAFFRAGEIEAWGRGIEKMSFTCKMNGNEKPSFKHDGLGLWTVFLFSNVLNVRNNVHNNVHNSVHDIEVKSLTERQSIILNLIRNDSRISIPKMSKVLSVSTKTIQRELLVLKSLNVLKHEGTSKSGKWVVCE